MGKVVAVEYTTLDGVFEEPAWSGPYFNDELAAWQAQNLAGADALLLGRKTYEGFKAAWPQMEAATGDFGVKINSMAKHVATTTLTEPEWNATFLRDEIADAEAKPKTEPANLLINGAAALVNYLALHNPRHECRVMIFRVLGGESRKLWTAGTRIALSTTGSGTTAPGAEFTTYVRAGGFRVSYPV